jgi:hypothetical protein
VPPAASTVGGTETLPGFYNKQELLDNGDQWEPLLAKRHEIDATYR